MEKSSTLKTKIVGTLGPNSNDVPMIEKMIYAGLTVARINMSHGDHDVHRQAIRNARKASKQTGRPLAILQDLSGPKIRIGDFDTEDVTLVNGKNFILTTKAGVGNVDKVYVNYEKLPQEVEVGMNIYLNDGKQKLLIEKVSKTEIHTKVISGGTIKGRRGVNIPDGNLSIPAITAKDKRDLEFGLAQKVDFITLSFVRNGDDIKKLRKLIGDRSKAAIVAKIETKAAINNLESIVREADVIMVARGDLAIETPLETVPLLQKKIIKASNHAGKPVITATQMLDSMRTSTTPTRAEAADIANAILDGTDALMLSDETTIGDHPDKAIMTMASIAREVENDEYTIEHLSKWTFPSVTVCDTVSRSIVASSRVTKAKVIAALSESGYTGRMIARHRPKAPIVVLTPDKSTFNKMLVVFGCEPVLIKKLKDLTSARKIARDYIISKSLAEPGETFILGAGMPFGVRGTTNTMLIEKI